MPPIGMIVAVAGAFGLVLVMFLIIRKVMSTQEKADKAESRANANEGVIKSIGEAKAVEGATEQAAKEVEDNAKDSTKPIDLTKWT